MEMIIRGAISVLDRIAQFFTPEDAPVLPAAKDDRGWADGGSRHGLAKPVAGKQASGIGADLNARADLALRHGLLKQRDVEASPTQRDGGRRAANAGADHEGMKPFQRANSEARGTAIRSPMDFLLTQRRFDGRGDL